MSNNLLIIFFIFTLSIFISIGFKNYYLKSDISGAPPYGESLEDIPPNNPYDFKDWVRPNGPPKVGLQAGHWKSSEAPNELYRLRTNTGSSGAGKSEWEVNHDIATKTADILRPLGIMVDILPATVPPQYWADVFVAIHADGSEDATTTGYKVSPPWRDFHGNSKVLSNYIDQSYPQTTNLIQDPNITRNMRGYYAFSYWKYEHALHPMTSAVILETGFLTNPSDRQIIINNSDLSAQGLAQGIIQYLEIQKLI